jgi:hypothetical protein
VRRKISAQMLLALMSIGAVGVSLFLLGLEITLPHGSARLSFSTVFERAHLITSVGCIVGTTHLSLVHD